MVLPSHLLEPLGMSLMLIAAAVEGTSQDIGNNSVAPALPMIFQLPLYAPLPRSSHWRPPIAVVSRFGSGAAGSSGRSNGAMQRGNSRSYTVVQSAGMRMELTRAAQLRAEVGMRLGAVAGDVLGAASRGTHQLPMKQ